MNPIPETSPQSLHISTPTDTSIVLVRAFNAPRRLVWEAMFTPDKMRRWMLPPPGWILTTCQCEPRVGGALDVAWKSDEADPAMTLRGKFTEVVLHERAVHTETMALGSGQEIGSLLEKLQRSPRKVHLCSREEVHDWIVDPCSAGWITVSVERQERPADGEATASRRSPERRARGCRRGGWSDGGPPWR